MLQTVSTSNYSHADIVAMLSALPKEDRLWTWNYLNSMIFMPELYTDSEKADIDNIPFELSGDILMTALQLSKESVKTGDYVRNEDIEDFVAKKMGWN